MSYFIKILQDSDKKIIEKCRESKNCLQNEGDRVRIFDHFPCLLPNDEINSLGTKFKAICDNIKVITEIKYKYFLTNRYEKESIKQWCRNIIKIGCTELLNNDGWIKQEIVHLLDWKAILSQKAISDIMNAYVSAIHQAILKDYCKTDEPRVLAAILHFINENNEQWVTDELTRSVFPLSTLEVEEGPEKAIQGDVFSAYSGLLFSPKPSIHLDKKENKDTYDQYVFCNI